MNARERDDLCEPVMVSRLVPSASNPRKDFKDEEQWELMESIRSVGVVSYLLVRPVGSNFEIVAGERRWRAAKALGLKFVPCRIRELSDEEVGKIQLIENIQRTKLSPVEELEGVRELQGLGIQGDELGKALGKSSAWVQQRLELGELPKVARDAVGAGRLRLECVPDLLGVSEEDCAEFVDELEGFEDVLPVATVRAMVEERYKAPRSARLMWRKFADEYETTEALEALDVLEDPAGWAEFVRPYGEGVGKWKLAGEKIGGLAAKAEEAVLTWGDLAKAHGIRRKLVPVGGVRPGAVINAVELVDKTIVESAEKAAKAAGQAFTLGARKGSDAGPGEEAPDEEELSGDEVAEAGKETFPTVTRETPWNPWAMKHKIWHDEEYANRVALVKEVLDGECPEWRNQAADACAESLDGVEEGDLVIWWVLAGTEPEELRGRRLAVLLGVREFWLERLGR